MITVTVNKSGNFSVNSTKIKKVIKDTLKREGIVSDFSVSVAVVGEDKMQRLVKKYYGQDPKNEYDHPILTFPSSEVRGHFVEAPEQIPSLGEIVLSYPSIVQEANETGKLVDEVAVSLAQHGAMHLLGYHH